MTTKIWSRSRLVVKQLMESLDEVRKIEKSFPERVEYVFGNLEDAKQAKPPRMCWKNHGGMIVEPVNSPSVSVTLEDGTVSTILAVGYRRSNYVVRIWERNADEAEILLDQLSTASRLLPRSDMIVVEKMPWSFPTELEGQWLENGAAVIDATVGIRVPVAKDPIGSIVDVVVAGSEFRAGISTNGDLTDVNAAEFDVDRLTGNPEWPG